MGNVVAFLKNLGWAWTLLLAVGGAAWALLTYQHQARLSFQRPMVDKHIGLCFEAANVAGQLVSDAGEEDWRKTVASFWRLYWGQLVLVENEGVARSMVKLGEKLKTTNFADRGSLGSSAYQVSRACRSHLDSVMANGWRIEPLSDLKVTGGP